MSRVLLTTHTACRLMAYCGLGLLLLEIRYVRRSMRGLA